jgi:hypothetical protein
MFWAMRIVMPAQTRRLQRALVDCARLARAQHVVTARAHARRRLVERTRMGIHGPKTRSAGPPPPIRNAYVAVEQLKRGMRALDALDVSASRVLFPWKGREPELIHAVMQAARGERSSVTRDEYRSAVRAGKIGAALDREQAFSPPATTSARAHCESDIRRASARLFALRIDHPLARETLAVASPAQVEWSVHRLRAAGLLDEGPGWTLKGSAVRAVVAEIKARLDADLHRDKGGSR